MQIYGPVHTHIELFSLPVERVWPPRESSVVSGTAALFMELLRVLHVENSFTFQKDTGAEFQPFQLASAIYEIFIFTQNKDSKVIRDN